MADMHENTMGLSKNTSVEDAVEANFRGETSEVGLYLAMAARAQTEGYPEVAGLFRDTAEGGP